MCETVKQRLIYFLESIGMSKAEFGRRIGVSSAFITSMRQSIQPDKIKSIALVFPVLNTDWLMTGNGKMLIESQQEEPPQNGDIGLLKELLREKDAKIEAQAKEIGRLEERIAHLSKRTISPLDAEDAECVAAAK